MPIAVLAWAMRELDEIRAVAGDDAVLACIVDRATRADPADRYASEDEILRALALWRASRARRATRSAATRGSPWVGALGLALTLIGGVLVARSLPPPTSPRVLTLPIGARSAPLPEPVVVDGVSFDPADAARAVQWVNEAAAPELAEAGIRARERKILLDGRPFADLGEIGTRSGIGPATMRAVAAAIRSPHLAAAVPVFDHAVHEHEIGDLAHSAQTEGEQPQQPADPAAGVEPVQSAEPEEER